MDANLQQSFNPVQQEDTNFSVNGPSYVLTCVAGVRRGGRRAKRESPEKKRACVFHSRAACARFFSALARFNPSHSLSYVCNRRWHYNVVSSLFRQAFTNQSFTIPRYNEHFSRFPSNSLHRGFPYNEPSI